MTHDRSQLGFSIHVHGNDGHQYVFITDGEESSLDALNRELEYLGKDCVVGFPEIDVAMDAIENFVYG